MSRLMWALLSVAAIVIINFLVIHLVPGDPALALVGDFPVPPDYIQSIRHDFGLDQPVLVQLWLYLVNLSHGNLGYSFANRQPVLGLVLDRSQCTLLLMLPALTLSAIIGIVLGIVAAPRAGTFGDSAVTAISLFGKSVPVFWLGQMLIIVFAVDLGWLPAQGMVSVRTTATGWARVLDVAHHLILPAFCVTIYYIAVVARVARVSILQALHQDFVLTAVSKGLTWRWVLWRHVLPNAAIPVVTVIGYNSGTRSPVPSSLKRYLHGRGSAPCS